MNCVKPVNFVVITVISICVFVDCVKMSFRNRPVLRSQLARAVYNKIENDARLREINYDAWYQVNKSALSETCKGRFLQLGIDSETRDFMDRCHEQSDFFFLQLWHTVAKSLLGIFMSQTSINGLLNRGRMFVWSKDQIRSLLRDAVAEHGHRNEEQTSGYSRELNKESGKIFENLVFSKPPTSNTIETSEVCPSPISDVIFSTHSSAHKIDTCKLSGDQASHMVSHAYSTSADTQSTESAEPESRAQSDIGDINAARIPGYSRPDAQESSVVLEMDREEIGWWSGMPILDLGAGDGHVTQILADDGRHRNVYVTESSTVMRMRLANRGFKVLDAFTWAEEVEDDFFGLITCLNLLDRCDRPVSLLTHIREKLSLDGLLVVALVLPLSPYVEGVPDHQPTEKIPVSGDTLELQVNSLVDDFFPSLGFELVRWTKVPYLCEGDMEQAFYWLSDVVLVMKKKR